MILDRDAARALFDNAAPMPATAGGAPFAAPAFTMAGDTAGYDRMSGRTARKGPDWRLIAPVGVAALCAVAVLVVASPRNDAEPGRTVAAADIARPAPTPAPVSPPIVEPPAPAPAPVVRARAVRAEPARRAPAPRVVARAPSAADATADVSAREPYVPPPSLGAPAQVTVTPVAPPPVATPELQP
ncbi:MAG: hypothetical protein WC068_05875 [Caulobacter sp.]